MPLKRRGNSILAIFCILTMGFFICVPVVTCTFDKGDCYLPPDEGNCLNRLSLRVKFYFDANYDECSEFIYYGCGGNKNRFDSFEECENQCVLKF